MNVKISNIVDGQFLIFDKNIIQSVILEKNSFQLGSIMKTKEDSVISEIFLLKYFGRNYCGYCLFQWKNKSCLLTTEDRLQKNHLC